MQKVAAYILERRDDLAWPEARAKEAAAIKDKIDGWLHSKGSKADGASGTYEAVDGSHATLRFDEARDDDRSWWFVQLDETTDQGRLFRVSVSVTNGNHAVAVYLTMEVGSSLINPVEADPKCPRLIRQLLTMPGRWYHGASQISQLRRVAGFEAGERLAAEIDYLGRTMPMVVITTEDGSTVLPSLENHLARDLAGLANVVVSDTEAAWALTDRFGRSLSCYNGAVRLYWPRFQRSDAPTRHSLWTAQRLHVAANDQRVIERFRRQMRGLIMRASALSVAAPREINEIRNVASRKAFADMKARANSLADYEALAESYAEENEKLRADYVAVQEQLTQCQTTIGDLELRLQNAEAQLRFHEGAHDELSPDPEPAAPDADAPPARGETRYYKKHYSTQKHDIMLLVKDCGCNSWEGAHSADKAKKGIAKLEGRSDWSSLMHCASCTGGGMWRVRW